MIAWATLAAQLALGTMASPATRLDEPATCMHADAPLLARVELAGGESATLSPGTVKIGDTTLTRCKGLPKAHPSAIARFGDALAIGFRDGGVYVRKNGADAWIAGLPSSPVRGLASASGTLWIATGTAGLFHSTGKRATRSPHHILGKRGITAVSADDAGAIHVGVDPLGHWIIAPDGAVRRASRAAVGCFRSGEAVAPGAECVESAEPTPGALPSDHITSLVVHRGELVVGFFDRGLAVRSAGGFAALEKAPRFVNALLSAGDTLYAATPKGLYRRVGDGAFARMRLALPSDHVNGLALGSDGTLWIATGAGLVGWAGSEIRVIDTRAGLPSRIVYAALEGPGGVLWVGTAAGLARVDGEKIDVFSESRGDLPHDWVTSLVARGDGVAVGTYDAGVTQCNARGCANLESFGRAWINPHGLTALAPNSTVLAATTLGDGLIVVDTETGKRAAVPTLPSKDVTSIVFYDGQLWVGTRGGLAVL